MRIGFFTDTYHPQDNGVAYVVDDLRAELESRGHEVFTICPSVKFAGGKKSRLDTDDERIIRVRSMPVVGPDATRLSLFIPQALLRRIKALKLDLIHMHTPSTLGILSAYLARKLDIPLVVQHHTDIYQYAEHYPALKAGVVLSSLMVPLAVRPSKPQRQALAAMFRPQPGADRIWSQRMLELLLEISYGSADAVIVQSRKSMQQIRGFLKDADVALHLIPNGVDPLPDSNVDKISAFRAEFALAPEDEVVTYFGRMAKEKNIDILIPMIEAVLKERPQAKLLLCGDNEYREVLMKQAAVSPAANRIVFSGRYKRVDLQTLCAVSDVYVYPATSDTQAIVINEAALGGLPLVLIDRDVNDVARCGANALFALNDPLALASQVTRLLSDRKMRARFGAASLEFAAEYSIDGQGQKITALYNSVRASHVKNKPGYIRIG